MRFGRENYENVVRTRDWCGWPSSPRRATTRPRKMSSGASWCAETPPSPAKQSLCLARLLFLIYACYIYFLFTFWLHSNQNSKYISSIFIVKWKYMNYFKESTKFKYYFIQLISTCYTKHEYKHKFK